jgi:hypothetical protein
MDDVQSPREDFELPMISCGRCHATISDRSIAYLGPYRRCQYQGRLLQLTHSVPLYLCYFCIEKVGYHVVRGTSPPFRPPPSGEGDTSLRGGGVSFRPSF